jgi:hypothetical protein
VYSTWTSSPEAYPAPPPRNITPRENQSKYNQSISLRPSPYSASPRLCHETWASSVSPRDRQSPDPAKPEPINGEYHASASARFSGGARPSRPPWPASRRPAEPRLFQPPPGIIAPGPTRRIVANMFVVCGIAFRLASPQWRSPNKSLS